MLAEGPVPVIELRASIVLGSGSLSFEMIRALSERLPVMVTPRWASSMAQPIAILDFWRVEEIDSPRLPRLRAEMKLPGRAWLLWELEPAEDGAVLVHQTAIFDPIGLFGLAYWYAVFPLHGLIFSGMLRGIARRAESGANVH